MCKLENLLKYSHKHIFYFYYVKLEICFDIILMITYFDLNFLRIYFYYKFIFHFI